MFYLIMQDGETPWPKEVRRIITKAYASVKIVLELNILLANRTNTIKYCRIKQLVFLFLVSMFIILMWKTNKMFKLQCKLLNSEKYYSFMFNRCTYVLLFVKLEHVYVCPISVLNIWVIISIVSLQS